MTTTAVLNQKGGVGKTTVTLGLASAAQAAGHKVLVVDLDPQASASWTLGIELDDDAVIHALLVDSGDTVPVGDPIAVLLAPDGSPAAEGIGCLPRPVRW